MQNQPNQPTQKQIQMNAQEEMLHGKYANAVNVSSTGREVIVDFAFVYPAGNENRASVVSRVILSPEMANNLAATISKTMMQAQQQPQQTQYQDEE